MANIHSSIQNYVKERTKGLVKLSIDDCSNIINMVMEQKKPFVKLLRFNGQNGSWEHMRNIETTQEKIDMEIKKSINHAPVLECYKFELYNENGQIEGTIFTINPTLF